MQKRIGALALLLITSLFYAGCSSSSSPTVAKSSSSGPAYTYPFVWGIGLFSMTGHSGNGQFSAPNGVLVYNNTLYVVDDGNHRVQKFDLNGNYLAQLSLGEEAVGITVDGNGVLYVASITGNSITKWDLNFNSLGTLSPSIATTGPWGLAVDSSNNIYIADFDGGKVIRCSNTGSGAVAVSGNFTNPIGVAVDGSGNLYVADHANNNVQKFNSTLSSGTTLIAAGTTAGLVNYPSAIAVDASGNLLVSDYGTATRVQKFSSSGGYLTSIAAPTGGQYNGTFYEIGGIATDPSNDVYLADNGYNVIYKYAPY